MLEPRRGSSMFVVCVTVGLALLASRYRNNVLRSVSRLCHGITVSISVQNKDRQRQKRASRSEEHEDDNNNDNRRRGDDDVEDEEKPSPPPPALPRKSEQRRLAPPANVILADSPEQCDYAVQRIRCNLSDNKVLGFDCEWVKEGPVSLLQLATRNGVCALFRLNKIGHVPPALKELLANRELLKVGVDPAEDGRRVAKDYNSQVLGTVDLRNLASRLGLASPRSLSGLCVQYLGVEIDKTEEVRCSDWDADSLAGEQITYAAADAYVSVLIYFQILEKARQKRTLWQSIAAYVKKYLYFICTRTIGAAEFLDLPQGVIDTRFRAPNGSSPLIDKINSLVNKNGQSMSVNKISSSSDETKSSGIPARNKPLYHNCYLQAPDGETLCTCDKKKAEWYISKQLGTLVQEDPFTVRLNFEPSGRALGEVGKYYTQVKLNQCVVCGASDKFIRKNVVPREYRKYFPIVMKSHQSHDVLLMCPTCHQESNAHDLQLRRDLARICDAPLSASVPPHVRDQAQSGWKKMQTAVKILRTPRTSVPLERRRELEMTISKYTGCPNVTLEMLDCLHEQLRKVPQPACKISSTDRARKALPPQQGNGNAKNAPHGLKVVEYFKSREGGLVELEKMWREHFLRLMKPKFLPELWSVSHNQERLNIRHTQNRIEPEDAKLAGIKS